MNPKWPHYFRTLSKLFAALAAFFEEWWAHERTTSEEKPENRSGRAREATSRGAAEESKDSSGTSASTASSGPGDIGLEESETPTKEKGRNVRIVGGPVAVEHTPLSATTTTTADPVTIQ